jgi:hypothetical protein
MPEKKMVLALFDDVDPASRAIDVLRQMGVRDDQMNVISGVPVTEPMLGRPRQWTNVPRLALGGAIGGFLLGVFLSVGPPLLYPIYVGGQPLIPVPPSIIILFEMTMLGLLVSTFIGVFLDSYFPSYRPKEYVPEISDGKIAVLFDVPEDEQGKYEEAMSKAGAEEVKPVEAGQL